MNKLPKITGLVLSAGFSSRMPGLKPLMNFEGKPFLAGILLKLAFVCDSIIVVTGHESEKIKNITLKFLTAQNHLINKKIIWQFNPAYKSGMFSSLQAGLQDVEKDAWVLYHFVDQPTLPPNFYPEFRNKLDENYDWIQPTYQKKKGHPILFSPNITRAILNAQPSQSLRAIKKNQKFSTKYWACNFPQVLKDFNSIEDVKNIK